MGEPRCPSSAIPRNLEQADLGRSTPPLATLVYTETKMSTHKHSEAGNELRSLSMIRYDQSMNATTQRSKDSHFWHLTPLPAHRQVHTSHTPTSGTARHRQAATTQPPHAKHRSTNHPESNRATPIQSQHRTRITHHRRRHDNHRHDSTHATEGLGAASSRGSAATTVSAKRPSYTTPCSDTERTTCLWNAAQRIRKSVPAGRV